MKNVTPGIVPRSNGWQVDLLVWTGPGNKNLFGFSVTHSSKEVGSNWLATIWCKRGPKKVFTHTKGWVSFDLESSAINGMFPYQRMCPCTWVLITMVWLHHYGMIVWARQSISMCSYTWVLSLSGLESNATVSKCPSRHSCVGKGTSFKDLWFYCQVHPDTPVLCEGTIPTMLLVK